MGLCERPEMKKYSVIAPLISIILLVIFMWNCGSYRKHLDLGKWYHNKGFLDEAVPEFSTVAKLKSDSCRAHYLLAITFTNRGWHDYAIKEVVTAFRSHPCDDYYKLIQIIKGKNKLEHRQEEPICAAK